MSKLSKLSLIGIAFFAVASYASCDTKSNQSEKTTNNEVDSIQLTAQNSFKSLPAQMENPNNALTPEKIALGKMLYYDTKLSRKGNVSCNSCHNLGTYGVDNLSFSKGDDGLNGGRNSPTVLNAALHTTQFWDGRAKDVEEQAGGPILNPVEMHIPNKAFLEAKLKKDETYTKMFAAAFPNEKNPLNFNNITMSIAAFERTLVTPSKFDDYLNGNKDALTAEEKIGLALFVKTGCTTCHSGSILGGQMFQKFDLFGNYWDLTKSNKVDSGRAALTKNPSEAFMFNKSRWY
ncbi:MAG: cytochrome-c peroxidase [Bacteroidetes bacterium]|nr:cytochrome-c peroxidase [Bacteroidota bacterium]